MSSPMHAELKKMKMSQQLLAILVLALVCVVFWVIVSLFNTSKESSISPQYKEAARALNPSLNRTVLERLENKRLFSEAELENFTIYRLTRSQDSSTEELGSIDATFRSTTLGSTTTSTEPLLETTPPGAGSSQNPGAPVETATPSEDTSGDETI